MTATTNARQRAIGATPAFDARLFDERCAALGVTAEAEKAALVGVNPTTVWRLRNGEIGPRLEVARRIADRLGVTVDDLWPHEAHHV